MIGQTSLLVFGLMVGCLAQLPPTFLEYKDSLGQYSFGYSAPGSARSEVRSSDGKTRGSYSYVDGLGNIQSAQYTADGENGFQIVATNLPQAPKPVEDTPEVTAAKIDHFKALEAASKLAEGNIDPEQTSGNSGVKSDDLGASNETLEKSNDPIDIQTQTSSPKSPENIPNVKSVEPENSLAREIKDSSMEPQNAELKDQKKASEKMAPLENENATILKDPGQNESDKNLNQVDGKSADLSGSSEVPVVTTSFVIPGSLNLRTSIQLENSGGAAGATSQSQAAKLNPSHSSPAATDVPSVELRKNAESLGGAASSSGSPKSTQTPIMEEASDASVRVISPSNLYGFTYGIGINPIYRHYSPYHYLPYAIL